MSEPPINLAKVLNEPNASILLAGRLAGLASRLDAEALEKFLESPPRDFRYEKNCRAAIAFKRAIALP